MTTERWEYLMTRKYLSQRNANILAFLTAPEYKVRREALKHLCKILNGLGIEWVFSCSIVLFFLGIIDDFNDFDVFIMPEDAEKVENALLAAKAELRQDDTQKGGYFSSQFYREGMFMGVHLDLIGNESICAFKTKYTYAVKADEIEHMNIDGNINISLCPVEACLVLYGMMEGWQARRRYKRELCREYLEETGIMYSQVLRNALDQGLPSFLEKIVKDLLHEHKQNS